MKLHHVACSCYLAYALREAFVAHGARESNGSLVDALGSVSIAVTVAAAWAPARDPTSEQPTASSRERC